MLVLCLSFFIALLDQATKYAIWRNFFLHDVVTVIPGIYDLKYVQNTGAAWGMFAGFNNWLVLLSVIMLLAIVVFRRFLVAEVFTQKVAMGLMIGGIVGNLLDRSRLGYVVDFLDFYWRGHHFPAFNVADSAICVGVGLYLLTQALSRDGRRCASPLDGASARCPTDRAAAPESSAANASCR